MTRHNLINFCFHYVLPFENPFVHSFSAKEPSNDKLTIIHLDGKTINRPNR